MNKLFFLQLVFNASLLLTLALVYDLVIAQRRTGRTSLHKLAVGVVIGIMGVIVMLASWELEPGIIFDTRSNLLGIAGLFFGTVPTIVAMAIISVFRCMMGGPALWMGIAVIFTSGAIGIGWRYLRRTFLVDITWRELYLFGWVIHLGMLGCAFVLPGSTKWLVLSNIALPVLLIYPIVTAVLGKLIANQLKRERMNQKLRESEERYQNLARISPVGIFRTDQNGATTYVNPMWCRISGLSEVNAMGDGWLQAVHPDDRECLQRDWQEATRLRKASFRDYRFLHPDGTVVWVMGQSTPEMNSENQIVGYVGTITDISERKQAEAAIRSSLAEKEVLLKEVHHRVKNNLMTIIGLIKMQEMKTPDKNTNSLLMELEGRIRSMAMVHEGLYKSKNVSVVDMQNYIETMAAHIRVQFGSERDIRFQLRAIGVELDLDIAVPCGLILNELIGNAYTHAFPDGRPGAGTGACEISVTVSINDGTLILSVADNGVGLPAGFDWEKSETLGLRLIKMLGQQIRGSIEFDLSAGTTVRLKFPVPIS